MRWLPFVVILIEETVLLVFIRASEKRSGRRVLLPNPIWLILAFVILFLNFSALGFAERRGMLTILGSSAVAGIVFVAIRGWKLWRNKLK